MPRLFPASSLKHRERDCAGRANVAYPAFSYCRDNGPPTIVYTDTFVSVQNLDSGGWSLINKPDATPAGISCQCTGHKAANIDRSCLTTDRPDDSLSIPVRLKHESIIWNFPPLSLDTHAVMGGQIWLSIHCIVISALVDLSRPHFICCYCPALCIGTATKFSVSKDDQRAFDYFSQIANTHPDEPPGTAQARIVANAFVALGHYYLKGIPNSAVAPDAVRARLMFSYAASYFGDADAQYQLGRLYLDGSPSDPRQAAGWFQLAATKGDCRAETVLGVMLFQGQLVPRQAARGLMWLTLARNCAGTDDKWIKPLYENAFRRANDDERAAALVYLEDWLKGRRD